MTFGGNPNLMAGWSQAGRALLLEENSGY